MNVQELIERLNAIEDKTTPVVTYAGPDAFNWGIKYNYASDAYLGSETVALGTSEEQVVVVC